MYLKIKVYRKLVCLSMYIIKWVINDIMRILKGYNDILYGFNCILKMWKDIIGVDFFYVF